MLRLPELERLRATPHAAVAYLMTERCTAACRHCSVRATATSAPAAPVERVRAWVRSIGEAPATRVLGITGGEPFLEREALSAALEEARAAGLQTVVYTNAYWAPSASKARQVLAGLPPIDLIQFGADRFHGEFVPLENLRHATEAALELDCGVWFQICDTEWVSYAAELKSAIGERAWEACDVSLVPILSVGRAADNAFDEDQTEVPIPEGGCAALATPMVRPDGSVIACCSEHAYVADRPGLTLGHLEETPYAEIVARALTDAVLTIIREEGPRGLCPGSGPSGCAECITLVGQAANARG